LFGRSQLFVFSSSRRIRLYHIHSLLSTPFSKKVEIFLRNFFGVYSRGISMPERVS